MKYLLAFLLVISVSGFATVSITNSLGISNSAPVYVGSGGTCNTSVGVITITEGAATDIGALNNRTYRIAAPVGFEFTSGAATTVTCTGAGLAIVGEAVDPAFYEFTYNAVGSDADINTIIITGLTMRCVSPGAGVIDLLRTNSVSPGSMTGSGPTEGTPHGYITNTFAGATSNAACQLTPFTVTLNAADIPSGFTTFSYWKNVEGPAFLPADDEPMEGAPSQNITALSFTYTADFTGDRRYWATATNGSCTLRSNLLSVTMNPRPDDIVDLGQTKTYNIDNLPIDLTDLIQPMPASTNISFSYPTNPAAVVNNIFYPAIAGIGSFILNYEITNSTTQCSRTGTYVGPSFPNGITINNPSMPPGFFNAKESYPICENDPDGFEFEIDMGAGFLEVRYIDAYYYTNNVLTITRIFNPGNNPGLYAPVIESELDPSRHDPTYKVKMEIGLRFNHPFLPINHDYFTEFSVDVLPRWNPQLSGLPPASATDGFHYLCSGSNDTITISPNQSSGYYEYSATTDGTTYFTPDVTTVVTNDGSNRKFVPSTLYAHLGGTPATPLTKLIVRYVVGAICADYAIDTIAFTQPIGINFTERNINNTNIYCHTEPIIFNLLGDPTLRETQEFYWDFGDGILIRDSINKDSIQHTYNRPGIYNVRMRTLLPVSVGCGSDQIHEIEVGAKPKADFEVFDNYVNPLGAGSYESRSTLLAPNPADASDIITDWIWDLNKGAGIQTDSDPNFTSVHQLTHAGLYTVTHIAEAFWGCRDTMVRMIPVFPVFPNVNAPSFPYLEPFTGASPTPGWFHSGQFLYPANATKSSWRYTASTDYFPDNTGSYWATVGQGVPLPQNRLDSRGYARYFKGDTSWVETPYFRLTDLERPFLSLRNWCKTQELFDGANIEYTLCDSAFGKERWYPLGLVNQGVEWYNSPVILGVPGLDLSGWSGTSDTTWKNSAFRLDDVKTVMETPTNPKQYVRFRINFGSNGDKPPLSFFDGFAFDDFMIGERNRQVVVEEFLTLDNLDNQETSSVDPLNAIDDQLIDIKYFVGHTGQDDVNDMNRADPSSRAFYYGIDEIPRAVIDGTRFQDVPFSDKWGIREYDKQILKVSEFEITPTATPDNGAMLVNATIRRIPGKTALTNRAFVVRIAILSDQEATPTDIPNVLRKMLPNAAGTFYQTHDWSTDLVLEPQTYNPIQALRNMNITNFKVVVYLQDHITKEILQASTVDFTGTLNAVADPEITQGRNLRTVLYPQPATSDVMLEFETPLESPVFYSVRNSIGVELSSGTLNTGNDLYELKTSQLVPGYYTLQLKSEFETSTLTFIKQ